MITDTTASPVRCAIYTRVPTEEQGRDETHTRATPLPEGYVPPAEW